MATAPTTDPTAPPPATGISFDLIVIGGGTMGLSAAYHAAMRGHKTLLLEQFGSLASAKASSGGASRIFRIMHSDAAMIRLAETALALWAEIESASGMPILRPSSLLFYGSPGNTVEGNLGEMPRVLAELGVPCSFYPAASDLLRQYPAFKSIPADYVGLAQANSAVIRAETSIAAFATLARAAGATLLTGQPATIALPSAATGAYRVSCPAGTYSAKHLVLCPGAWANTALRPFGVALDLTIWQTTIAYFPADVAAHDYPLWYEFGPPPSGEVTDGNLFYGFPPDERPGCIKVSADFTSAIFTDPGQCTYQPDAAIVSRLGAFLQQRFNGVNPTATEASTCLYTMSADGQMVLDRLDRIAPAPNAAIFTGDSGRGFKFTPLVGRILVDLATTGHTCYDIAPFAITRPGIVSTSGVGR